MKIKHGQQGQLLARPKYRCARCIQLDLLMMHLRKTFHGRPPQACGRPTVHRNHDAHGRRHSAQARTVSASQRPTRHARRRGQCKWGQSGAEHARATHRQSIYTGCMLASLLPRRSRLGAACMHACVAHPRGGCSSQPARAHERMGGHQREAGVGGCAAAGRHSAGQLVSSPHMKKHRCG